MDLILVSIIFLALAFFALSICNIDKVCLGLPYSIFSGRFKLVNLRLKFKKRGTNEADEEFSTPLRRPYKEGLGLKWPWWKVESISREIRTLPITEKEYQLSGFKKSEKGESESVSVATGGTVLVSGVIQYRPSRNALYRFVEVDEEGINKGLGSELDQIIGHFLGEAEMEEAITRKKEASKELWERLTGKDITPVLGEEKNGHIEKRRKIFGVEITYAEHCYGIEVVKANIDSIQPTSEIKKERDAKQKERYQKESEIIEWTHLRDRMKELRDQFPELSDEKIVEAVQVWKGQAQKKVNELRLDGLEEFLKTFLGR
jgi:regulator of protease activity HflC (stomatin/prohibitin superfamily)